MAVNFDYDRAVGGYDQVRRGDPRIAAQIWAALGDAETVLNVGAGPGSYEPTDRPVVAVEPSAAMRGRRPGRLAPAVRATAEHVPFDDGAFGGATAIYTVHHWPDLVSGLREVRRVTRGPVVVMTSDGPALDAFWRAEYVAELVPARRRYPALDVIAAGLGGRTEIQMVPIPFDCLDGFVEAFYGRPERLLDPAVRAAQSAWGTLDDEAVARFEQRLSADLQSGEWDRRHGALRRQPTYQGSVRLVISRPA